MRVIQGWSALARSSDYDAWLGRIETDGDFEKRASAEEMKAAVAALAPAIAVGLIPIAQSALANGGADSAAMAELIRLENSPDGNTAPFDNLLNNLEDDLITNCKAMEQQLRSQLCRPLPNERHAKTSREAAAFWKNTISPAMRIFCDLARGNPDRVARANVKCASFLVALADTWERSGNLVGTQRTLEMALEHGRNTPAEHMILKELARVRRKKTILLSICGVAIVVVIISEIYRYSINPTPPVYEIEGVRNNQPGSTAPPAPQGTNPPVYGNRIGSGRPGH
jgi:hypothetical protein